MRPGVKFKREVVRGVPADYKLFLITPLETFGQINTYDLWFAKPGEDAGGMVKEAVCEIKRINEDDSAY